MQLTWIRQWWRWQAKPIEAPQLAAAVDIRIEPQELMPPQEMKLPGGKPAALPSAPGEAKGPAAEAPVLETQPAERKRPAGGLPAAAMRMPQSLACRKGWWSAASRAATCLAVLSESTSSAQDARTGQQRRVCRSRRSLLRMMARLRRIGEEDSSHHHSLSETVGLASGCHHART